MEESEHQLDHDRLIALINSLSDGFLATDSVGTIQLSNGAALNILNANVLIGQNLYQILVLSDKNGAPTDLANLLKSSNGHLDSSDYYLKGAEGKVTNLHLIVTPVKGGYGDASQGGLVITLHEISPPQPATSMSAPTPVA
jgi:PAS domain-containing protein